MVVNKNSSRVMSFAFLRMASTVLPGDGMTKIRIDFGGSMAFVCFATRKPDSLIQSSRGKETVKSRALRFMFTVSVPDYFVILLCIIEVLLELLLLPNCMFLWYSNLH